MNPKLKKYEAVFLKGELKDDQIARMVKVPVADVIAARAEFCPAPVEPVPAAVEPVEPSTVNEAGEPAAEVADAPVDAPTLFVEQVAALKSELANHGVIVAAAAVVAAEPCPANVRVTVTRNVTGPKRQLLHLGFRAVYGGEMAQWLWANHRDIVEAYPPVKP